MTASCFSSISKCLLQERCGAGLLLKMLMALEPKVCGQSTSACSPVCSFKIGPCGQPPKLHPGSLWTQGSSIHLPAYPSTPATSCSENPLNCSHCAPPTSDQWTCHSPGYLHAWDEKWPQFRFHCSL